MAKTRFAGVPTHPGLAGTGRVSRFMHVHPAETTDAYFPANPIAWLTETITLMNIGLHTGYVAAHYTETLDNLATADMGAAGYLLTSNATAGDNDDMTILSDRENLMAADKIHWAFCRVKMTDVDKQGFAFGFVTADDVEIISADPTDGVFLYSGTTVATLVGRTVENGNASADTGTLATLVDDTFVEVGMIFNASTVNADNWGVWYVNGTATPFTQAQIEDLDAMVTTTAPTFGVHIGTRNATSSTTQKVLTIDWACGMVDR